MHLTDQQIKHHAEIVIKCANDAEQIAEQARHALGQRDEVTGNELFDELAKRLDWARGHCETITTAIEERDR